MGSTPASHGDDNPDLFDNASTAGRRVAWGAVILVGCAFSYSIGWQKGWTEAESGADQRLSQLNQTFQESSGAIPAQDPVLSTG
jgi:hypothetical protein